MTSKKGLLFYYDWFDQLAKLSDKDLKDVLSAMVRYHRDGEKPPHLEGMADMALGFIIPQIDRMNEKATIGKQGGRPKKSGAVVCDTAHIYNNEENPLPQRDNSIAMDCALNDEQERAQDTLCKTETVSKNEQGEENIRCDKKAGKEKESQPKDAYGDFKNVFLTKEEYDSLARKFPCNYSKRINDLSYYIQSKGTKYASHYAVILNWDRSNRDSPTLAASTFDTDDFFQTALKKSEEKMRKRMLESKNGS